MPPNPAGPVLLYVEDEILIQGALLAALEEAGFSVLVADGGEQALAVLAAEFQSLHGLITDVDLGGGFDGWQVARAARKSVIGLPVIYVSAASEHEWAARGVPNSLMIAKPFVSAQVVRGISSLLSV